ncbi:putative N-acetyltransferase 8B [Hemiscyllium ocellatum]|uniref:putative N-acetyltransferase 8B n=1 Tax=Hemiscyllium ocellatum TaxID=170820 RepID=UPI00296673A2|nr:putative N-acetyltransferase 8B [Hemiscyllium ocellatum]XP_060679103.1 putative N-acetyltransferase 8B [Hemiscyllium ocellatum]XP_060679106.1 putative N-acetyltransferase 8B [Hemiscyllium ocellatum]
MPAIPGVTIRPYRPGDLREAQSIVGAGLMGLVPSAFGRAAGSPSNVALVAALAGAAYALSWSLAWALATGLTALGLLYLLCRGLFSSYVREVLRTDMADIEGSYPWREGCGFWVAQQEAPAAGLVGTVALAGEPAAPGACRLLRLSVRRSARRQGVAEGLVRTALAFASAHGYRQCVLETSVLQQAALGLYRKLGFRTVASELPAQSALLSYLTKITLTHLEKRL